MATYGREQLIKLNPERLEEYTANLATLVQQLCARADELKNINKTAQMFWNEGVGEDVSSYGVSLDKNINLIKGKLSDTLNDYVKTMNVLASTVRNIAGQNVATGGTTTSLGGTKPSSQIDELNNFYSSFRQFDSDSINKYRNPNVFGTSGKM